MQVISGPDEIMWEVLLRDGETVHISVVYSMENRVSRDHTEAIVENYGADV